MKTILLALCFLGSTAAFGQVGAVLYNEPSVFDVPSHPHHASRQSMRTSENLRDESDVVSARGERPLWEVAPKIKVVPLGDIARELKKEHEAVKKSDVIWEN
jgi:hypothetical protein